jgi:DNA-binding GntR family transcriptional regulator
VDRITDALRQDVISGRLEPGLRLRQDDVASRLGVSRTPLREALRRLQAEGWFEPHPRQGITVAGVSVEEVISLATARLALEPVAARLAAETHDEQAAGRLRILVEERHSQDVDLRPIEFQELNRDYHFEIYGVGPSCPETEISRLTVSTWEKFSRYRLYYWRDRQHVRLSARTHQEIADLWLGRDGSATEHAVAAHILDAISDQIYSLTPEYKAGGPLLAISDRYGLADRLVDRP